MPILQHFKWFIKRFFLGAEPDNNKELSGEKDSGAFIDANNMRYDNEAGENYILKKINGEEVRYPNVDNACTTNTMLPLSVSYKCIGIGKFFSQEDNRYHEIEFWADSLAVDPSLIRIDGKIVLRSAKFPIDTEHPLQMAINDSCIGGEIYITDFFNDPMIFNLKDLMVNSRMLPDDNGNLICTQKYFLDFNIDEFILVLNLPVDHPVFVKLATSAPFSADSTHLIFLGPGFNVGQVQYAIRYVTAQGDKTAWSLATPLIPIPKNLSTASDQYPSIRSFGANPTNGSSFGVHFRFRCVNILNYDFMQVKRIKYLTGQALGSLGIEEQLATNINISDGQIDIINVYDSGSVGIPLNDNQAITSLTAVEAAKAIRYLNQRLFLLNVQYASRDLDGRVVFKTINGEETFPVIQNIDKAGHNDPYTRAYYKSDIRGEKASFSVSFFDTKGIGSFAVPLLINYQFPNRRDELAAGSNSETYSPDGVVRAANVSGAVSKTFEVFDLSDAVNKTDRCTFKNILKDVTDGFGFHVAGKGVSKVNDGICAPVSASHPGAPPPLNSLYTTDSVGYRPFHPISQGDANVSSHDYWINTAVRRTSGTTDVPYNPKGFGPTYYSMGLGVAGVDVSSLPPWVQSFSVNRSKSAKRVFCQGLGYYKLESATSTSTDTSKIREQIIFHSPDVAQNSIALLQTVIDDVAAGGTRYKLQLVSPLGFFTEVYNGNLPGAGVGASDCIDMINYCRIVRENGDINIGDLDTNVGLNGGDGYGYVAYGKWRNPVKPNGAEIFTNCAGGNQLFDIATITSTTVGRQDFYIIETALTMFNHSNVGGSHEFDDANIKKFHEPVYMVNIIDTKADVPNTNIDDYLETPHYQKLDAIIGRSNGNNTQVFPLVDERREDCIPDIGDSTKNCLVFVKYNGTTTAWINVVEKSAPQILAILTAIQAGTLTETLNGVTYSVQGICTNNINPISLVQVEYEIIFDTNLNPALFPPSMFVPITDGLITVKYDSSIPIKVFGGEGIIGESVFAPFDLENNSSGSMLTNFVINIGMPYRVFLINERVYILHRANGPTNYIADDNYVKFYTSATFLGGKIRQLLAMYTCESRADMCYAFNVETPTPSADMFFPLIHYIMRPQIWTDTSKIQAQYLLDFVNEDTIWGFGGFRFLPHTNIDYSHLPETQRATGKPKIGFKEETDFCSRIIWSEPRPINVVNSPGVRTFNPLNFFDMSDDTGEIKYAYDDRTDKNGSNLYAFTNSGVCLLMTDKRVLHELTGSQLAAMGSDETSVILQQIWMSKVIGMDDEMWRSAAEWSNVLWWTNYDSVYSLEGGKITDIANTSHYHSKIYNEFIKNIQPGYQSDVMAVYDTLHSEYWVGGGRHATLKISFSNTDTLNSSKDIFIAYKALTPTGIVTVLPGTLVPGDSVYVEVSQGSGPIEFNFTGVSIIVNAVAGDIYKLTLESPSFINPFPFSAIKIHNKMYVYSDADDKKHFIGTFDYSYDKFVCIDNIMFGARRMQTDTLNEGFVINDDDISAYSTQVYSPEQFKAKEFIRYRVNTDTKPSRVEFFYDMAQYESGSPVCFLDTTSNAFALRDRNGWEQYINRETAGVRKRVQARSLIVKTIHDRAEDYQIIDAGVQYKLLK